jgi:leucyl-tRNA synthetase
MPQWAGSSWYFLRYADPKNKNQLASKEALARFLPVDYYVGGVEHAVLHLLYARFYTKFLKDIGVVDFDEPFTKLFNQGMITRDGRKMDKSGGNGVSPDDIVERYGCDTLRMYEMFISPPELDAEWQTEGIEGVFRFVNKLWRFISENKDKTIKPTKQTEVLRNKFIYDVTTRLERLTLNTVVSAFMEYTNKYMELAKNGGVDMESLKTFAVLLAPFAPHLAEEIWSLLGGNDSVFEQRWCEYDESKIKEEEITIALQINGKMRGSVSVAADADKETVIAAAKEKLASRLLDNEIIKEIYVPGKIVNLLVKQS